jgi:tripartite-type tricarboxylate transporter receptor subunit TctC
MKIIANIVVRMFACLTALLPLASFAQTYPSRPITIVVPYGPGSGNDMIAREIAQQLTNIMKTTVLVENKAGATGNIATDYVAQAKPDGYTIFLTSTSSIINQVTNPAVKTDLSKDFDSIAFAASLPYVVAVPPSLPAKTLSDVVKLAKASPGKLNYNGPSGSVSDYLGTKLKASNNLDMVMIPYKSTSDAQIDVLAGRIQVWFTTAASAVGLAKGDKIRVIAVTGDTRLAALPDVPTVKEAGIPGMFTEVSFFFVAPAGTPKDIVDKLSKSIDIALQSKDVENKFANISVQVKKGSPLEVNSHIKSEMTKWAEIARGVAK